MTSKQKPYCPKCRSNNTHSYGESKFGVRGYKKLMIKWMCNNCKHEFWL